MPWALGRGEDGPSWEDLQTLLPCPGALRTSPSFTRAPQLRYGAQPAPQKCSQCPTAFPEATPTALGGFHAPLPPHGHFHV